MDGLINMNKLSSDIFIQSIELEWPPQRGLAAAPAK